MKRGEKVKDIVDIRPFTHLHDFAADAGLTLASYHFTDITSDLMGKWIERISDVRPGRGDAVALAGNRGVGKSHFISVLTAISARVELRPLIPDPHALSRANLLTKRSILVASVRRGSGSSLLDEVKSAFRQVFQASGEDLSDSLYEVLARGSKLAGETPLLIFVDTAMGRSARVDRDDGALLSEIADAAKSLGIFVGITLDDDISGADGPNSSIARSFHIDFLDQEHLYKIVDRHIFVKDNSVRPILKEIYAEYQKAIPGFSWSEPRFLSLYPLHPATIEISPLIRLFIQDFALLGFASEAGVKVLGRPADSLIGLDEMFDSVEARLRKVPELSSAFTNYDLLEQTVVSKTPVHFRLQAKLCLKGLFMLSLDGQGVSAPAIAASMMIFDEGDPAAGPERVAGLLDSFAASAPAAVIRTGESGNTLRYRIDLGVNEDLEQAIKHLVPSLTDKDLWAALVDHLAEKFPEIHKGDQSGWATNCTIEWRGSLRRGEIAWFEQETPETDRQEHLDWILKVRHQDNEQSEDSGVVPQPFFWDVAPLSAEDRDTIARYYLLKSDPDIKERFGRGYSNVFNLLSRGVEKICRRVFFDDAYIAFRQNMHPFECEVESTHNLSHLFTQTLASIFDERYPDHPVFVRQLGLKEVSSLISDFFGGTSPNAADVQEMARSILKPLGLAGEGPDGLVSAAKDDLAQLGQVQTILQAMKGSDTLMLNDVAGLLLSEPFGLTRESQQLILAALVSQREIEFVTITGNRINHRSLDLHVIWDDVLGIATPSGKVISTDLLLSWARTIASTPAIDSFTAESDVAAIRDSFEQWQREWNEDSILDEYDGLPDESLNAFGWRKATAVRKSLGAVTEYIHNYLAGSIELEECLESVAELFLGSVDEFEKKKSDLRYLQILTRQAHILRTTDRYLSASDPTTDSNVERKRAALLDLKLKASENMSSDVNEFESTWGEFRRAYTDHYISMHQKVFETMDRQGELRDLISSKEWQVFEVISMGSSIDLRAKRNVEEMMGDIRRANCNYNPIDFLDDHTVCGCGLPLRRLLRLSEFSHEVRRHLETVTQAFEGAEEESNESVPLGNDRAILQAASVAGII